MENSYGVYEVKGRNIPILLLILSITFSFYYLEIGFAFKPFMIFSIVFFLLSLKSFYVHRLRLFEIMMLIFFGYYCLTGMFAEYPIYSLRMIFGVFLVLFCYFVIKYILSIASIEGIERSISIGGLIFNGISLVLYIVGVISLNFMLLGNQIREYGVLMDRGFPRLIGLANDPNIYCFYNFIFFFYYLTHLNKKWSKIGLILSALTLLLTMSRGGVLSIVFGLALMFITVELRTKIKLLIVLPVVFFLMNFLAKISLNIDVFKMIINRFTTDDGGSGRSVIWKMGLSIFQDSPLFGVGIFNYIPTSGALFGSPVYMHNSYLEALIDGGLVGIVLYLTIFIFVFVAYFSSRKLINDNGYLIFSFASVTIMMGTYSFMINEIFFLVLALICRYLIEINNKKEPSTLPSNVNTKKIKKRKKYKIVW